jgi:hypothetical protein
MGEPNIPPLAMGVVMYVYLMVAESVLPYLVPDLSREAEKRGFDRIALSTAKSQLCIHFMRVL